MNDTISRQAAVDIAKDLIITINGYEQNNQAVNNYYAKIMQLPPAQPEQHIDADGTLWITVPDIKQVKRVIVDEEKSKFCRQFYMEEEQRTGRWERHYSRPNVYADLFWHCSECGYKNNDDYAPTYHKFCPNCGIKMIQTDKTCDCYSDGRCVGTKEIDSCSCGGVKSKCDFYENVRREGDAG